MAFFLRYETTIFKIEKAASFTSLPDRQFYSPIYDKPLSHFLLKEERGYATPSQRKVGCLHCKGRLLMRPNKKEKSVWWFPITLTRMSGLCLTTLIGTKSRRYWSNAPVNHTRPVATRAVTQGHSRLDLINLLTRDYPYRYSPKKQISFYTYLPLLRGIL